jgi:HAD superfamily hydrolase (TIGR01509 family)
MVKHILFDNDGTIVDSEIIAVRVMLRHLNAYGVHIDEHVYSRRYPGLLERDILAMIRAEYQVVFPEDFLDTLRAEHRRIFDAELRAIPGMPGLFRKLRVPKSMVSNGSVRHVVRSLRRVRLHSALDGHIFSAEQVERPKPYPDVYLHALATLQLEAREVLVVEDSPTGVEAAKKAGLPVVGFLGATHIAEGHEAQLRALGADFIAKNARDLGAILAQKGAF